MVVTLEAPGMERDDFNIKAYDDVLRVSGEKRSPHTTKEGRHHVTECAYGYLERIGPLPASGHGGGGGRKI